ncbi:ABC transporter permease [Tanticharoenia sakaeratensis]|uniref:Oligopeptide ABC transporter permease protein OppC n=1 Tax=Tanticharoenia sakaeratensis NBRC 103193 TaxID=1231623 RepID=A0A0D6ML22_9PROT|nr:ABC transporter permease [Tanticharoenia sakaeratensis]GAN54160.1 oligopeptide ABC transporter permease protein OppC [Tanticharoenia sakaeratensis NBRC 103193]GBQ19419.1 peptide ABC transporter permease [Tanticharoenia sakaeratensis NBRC 103193]
MSAWRALVRRLDARIAASVLAVMVVACLAAPLYAACVARTDPFMSNIGGSFSEHGVTRDIMQPDDNPLHLGLTPIGPQWHAQYLLGADGQGRDVATRVLYGGRSSLLIAAASAALCMLGASILGICAGYFGGWTDTLISRLLDIFWAVPVYLFAISISIVTISHALRIGPFSIAADNLLLPIGIIATVYLPYAARPIRARARSIARTDYVLAARGYGASHSRVILREVLPNLWDLIVTLAPLVIALTLLAESALSFLSLGVQAPAASWGTIILDGEGLLYRRPAIAIAPGIAIVTVVLCLNVLGDALRAVLDPKAGGRV